MDLVVRSKRDVWQDAYERKEKRGEEERALSAS